MSKTRAQHLEEYERWADRVQPGEFKVYGRSQELIDLLDLGIEPDEDEKVREAAPTRRRSA